MANNYSADAFIAPGKIIVAAWTDGYYEFYVDRRCKGAVYMRHPIKDGVPVEETNSPREFAVSPGTHNIAIYVAGRFILNTNVDVPEGDD